MTIILIIGTALLHAVIIAGVYVYAAHQEIGRAGTPRPAGHGAPGVTRPTINPFSRGLGLGQWTASAASSPRTLPVGLLPLLNAAPGDVFVRTGQSRHQASFLTLNPELFV